jgi:hypothetical protein
LLRRTILGFEPIISASSGLEELKGILASTISVTKSTKGRLSLISLRVFAI